MPNWIRNDLAISTTHPELQNTLQQLADKNDDQGFFSVFFPRPVDIDDWYTWSINNWGTKWDVEADVIPTESTNSDAKSFRVVFDSAWDAPQEFLFQFAHQFNQNGYGTDIDLHFLGLEEAICGYMTTTPDIAQLTSEHPNLVKDAEIGWVGGCYDALSIRETDPSIAARFDKAFPGFIEICQEWLSNEDVSE